ncbi:hypothetical protein R75465_07303 [Paraburkholderia aspalathi]|uniref:VOC family protein n=1 Tax=Paraburkholderia aspalathi TaxID=1324617 RepID=UPI001AFE75DA|nr:VOC family protein [Paraburkholderia aspalathi]CAE6853779.1 hypothetical protein R75465_07303 [Paraburkholderia aspalathi]
METTLSSPHGVSFGRLAPGLGVQDINRSLQFYCGVLGFNKVFENGNPVGFVILKKDKAELHLSQNKNHKASLNNVAHLMVEDATVLMSTARPTTFGSSRPCAMLSSGSGVSCWQILMGIASILARFSQTPGARPDRCR